LQPVNFQIYMEMKDIKFQDLVDAKLAATSIDEVDTAAEETFNLVADKQACVNKFDDSDWQGSKTASVEFDNLIFNSLLKDPKSVDIVFNKTLPLLNYFINGLAFKTDSTAVKNRYEGKTVITGAAIPQQAKGTYRPFCFYPDSDQTLKVVKKSKSYKELPIKFTANAHIKVYDKAKKKYHNANGARAIIQNVLKKEGMLNGATFPETIQAVNNNTISITQLQGFVRVMDYKEENIEFNFE